MVHFISFLSTMTARAPDSNLEGGKKEKKLCKCPCIFFFFFFNSRPKTFQSKL